MKTTDIIIGKEFAEKVIPLIRQCKKSIHIIVYDWRWYPDQVGSAIQKFNNEIAIAKGKGKEVMVLTNFPHVIRILRSLNFEVKENISKKTLHTKLMIIDNEIVILGSHNYTMNAFTLNHEVSIITQEEKVVARLKLYFENLWGL